MQILVVLNKNEPGCSNSEDLTANLKSVAEIHNDVIGFYNFIVEIIPMGSATRDVRFTIAGDNVGSSCVMDYCPGGLPAPQISQSTLGIFDTCASFSEPWLG